MRIGKQAGLNMQIGQSQSSPIRVQPGSVVPVPETDYDKLENKPQINGVELAGNKTTRQLGIEITDPMTNFEIEDIIQRVMGGN